MTLDTQLWFPQNDPVLGVPQPTVDGFVDDRGTTITSPDVEDRGYGTGARVEWSAGTTPDMIVSAIRGTVPGRHDPDGFIYLCVTITGDPRFDVSDRVTIALRANTDASSMSDARRVDMYPVEPPDGAVLGSGTDHGGMYDIRTNHDVYAEWWEGSAASSWSSVDPPDAAVLKARSWRVNTTPARRGWAVEVRLPVSQAAAGGGGPWIDLEERFSLFISATRAVESDTAAPWGVQYNWPRASAAPRLWGTISSSSVNIANDFYGTGYLGAAPPQGVKVRRNSAGIPMAGVKRGGTISTVIDTRQTTPPAAPGPANANEFVAVLHNDHATDPADGVIAEFRMAPWGVPGPATANWQRVIANSGTGTNPTSPPISIPNGTGTTGSGPDTETPGFIWRVHSNQIPSGNHGCIWVLLSAPGHNVNFVEAGVRVNMDFRPASGFDEQARLAGRGWPKPVRGQRDRRWLFETYARRIAVDYKEFLAYQEVERWKGDYEEYEFFAWETKVYLFSTRREQSRADPLDLYVEAGSFGHAVAHRGRGEVLRWKFEGDFEQIDENSSVLHTPLNKDFWFGYSVYTEPGEWPDDKWPRDEPDKPRLRPVRLPFGPKPGLFTRGPDDPRPLPRRPD